MIKPEYLQAAIKPTSHVMEMVAGVVTTVERVQMVTNISSMNSLCIGVGFEGDGEGGIYLIVDRVVGKAIWSRMSGDGSGEGSSSEVIEALKELLNMVAGNAVGILAKSGLRVGITPPVLHDDPPTPPYGAGCAMIFMNSELGGMKVGLVLAEKNR